MKWNAAIVLTTVRIPILLAGYVTNLKVYKHSDVGIVVIGDKKTPEQSVRKLVSSVTSEEVEVEFWDVRHQSRWLKNYPDLDRIVPYNSDNRRNLGFLIAAEKGARIVISIDDDNYASNMDFFGLHAIVGRTCALKTVRSKSNWYNPCELLKKNPQRDIYPRGFPFNKRWKDDTEYFQSEGKIMLNMGLWSGDPDVDAVTNLAQPTKIQGIKNGEDNRVMLASGTFAPINTQNTAFHRDVLPAYYYIKMGLELNGLKLDRYGDIWSGLFVKKVLDTIGHRVSIGVPLTEHRRNRHNLLNDLQAEVWGMIITEKLADWIEPIELSGKSYADASVSLANKLREFRPKIGTRISQKVAHYFEEISACMETWVDTCDTILAN